MDTTRFAADLTEIPRRYAELAETLQRPDEGRALVRSVAPSRILVLGMGSSRYAAAPVVRAARAAGTAAWEELASAIELPPPAADLLVVAVSATGRSAEVLDAAERYAGRGRLLAVTNDDTSALAQLADALSPLHAGLEASGVACRTYRHTLVVLERVLGLTDPAQAATELDRAARASQTLLDTAPEWIDSLAQVLFSPDGTHLLAPVERLGSAMQSALMIRELPRRLAVGCETADWAHVDLYTARTHDYRAAIFTGSRWDEQAVSWLIDRKATFAAIGGELEGAALSIRFEGDDDARVRRLVETLPIELVADSWLSADPEFAFSTRPVDARR